MADSTDWEKVTRYLDDIYTASVGLEEVFPGRKFTLDGHLVGSTGEVVAAYMFDLELNPASTQGHDARSRDGRRVEIKLTQGKSVAIRHEPEHLIVLHRANEGAVQVIFNGPGSLAWAAAGKKQKNGQRPVGLGKLAKLAASVPEAQKLPVKRNAPV